jgi:hypothetical protein
MMGEGGRGFVSGQYPRFVDGHADWGGDDDDVQ